MRRLSGQSIISLEARLRSAKGSSGTKFKGRKAPFSLRTGSLSRTSARERCSARTAAASRMFLPVPTGRRFFQNFRLTFHVPYGIVSECVKAHKSQAEVFTLTLWRAGRQAFIGQTENPFQKDADGGL